MEHMFIVSSPSILKLRYVHNSDRHLVLPHLYLNEDYVSAYRALRAQGDYLFQDNSLFELKKVVAGDLIEFGKLINANEIVVPEVLRDADGSIELTEQFFASEACKASRDRFGFAAVIQGKSYAELVRHYNYLSKHPKIVTICIPFNFEFDAFGDINENHRQLGWNRFSIIMRMCLDGTWRQLGQGHHLLGLFNPIELAAYTYRFKCDSKILDPGAAIRSNDSSSCFWHSLYGVEIDPTVGLLYRKIESHVDFNVRYNYSEQDDLFQKNARTIKSFASRFNGTTTAFMFIMAKYRELASRHQIQIF